MTEEERTTMRVILCKPDERAVFIEMEDSLEAMQSMVGGLIEEYMPWDDEVALICNEEGKMNGLPLNRGIKDEDGHLQDIIAGDFFICYAPIESERFLSMPPAFRRRSSYASSSGATLLQQSPTRDSGRRWTLCAKWRTASMRSPIYR